MQLLSKDEIERINELAKKAKNTSLTEAEKKEQTALRKAYIQNIRHSFTNQLKSMTVIDPEGKDVTPEKVKQLQKNNKKH